MEFQQLGLSRYNISRIGFGCAPMGGYDYGQVDDSESIASVQRALELGINFYETADIYGFGHSEELLAKALGNNIKSVTIASKFGLKWDSNGKITRDCSSERVVKALENSLRRLKLDTIDLYQIHWPDHHTPIEQTIEALLKCQKAGKIKNIGCSNFEVNLIESCQKHGRLESLQYSYNLLSRSLEKNHLACCKKHKMSVITHSSLARGFLSGKYTHSHVFSDTDTRKNSHYFSSENMLKKKQLINSMKSIANKYGKTISQVALRWLLENQLVTSVVVGIKNIKQLEENIGSLGWQLSDKDIADLNSYSNMFIDSYPNQ